MRRRDVTAALGERLRGADDAFGACHLAAQAAGTELGARSAAIEAEPASTPPSRSTATAAATTSWSCRSTAAAR